MFGNNGITPQDWGQLALMGGLSILANNNGRMNNGQLIANGGLDALAGLQARKQYEAAMARQRQEAEANKWHMDTTNGMMIDKITGIARPIEGWKGKPSSDMERYLSMTPEERKIWDARELAMKMAGRNVTNINNNTNIPYQSSYQKSRGESASKTLDSILAAGDAAEKRLADYDALDRLYAGGLKTGWGENIKNEAARILLGMGLDQETLDSLGFQNVANVEGLINLQNKAVMKSLLDQKGVQTEGDAQRAAKTWASLGNSPAGNLWINQYARNVARREMEYAEFMDNEMDRNGGNLHQAKKAWREYVKKLPSVVPDAPAKLASKATPDVSSLSDDELLKQLTGASF